MPTLHKRALADFENCPSDSRRQLESSHTIPCGYNMFSLASFNTSLTCLENPCIAGPSKLSALARNV